MQPCTSIVPVPYNFSTPLCASVDITNSIHVLPPEVIQQLFTHFRDVADFCILSETCKRMYTIASHIPIYPMRLRSTYLSGFTFLRNHHARDAAQQLAMVIAQQDSLDNQPCQAILEKEEAFYKTFKQCCLKPNAKISKESVDAYQIADHGIWKMIRIHLTNLCHTTLALRSKERLRQELYNDLIATTANQLTVATLYIDFKPNLKVLGEIINLGPINKIHFSDIEQRLREAIRAKYQTVLENKALEYSTATLTSPLVAGIKEEQTRNLLDQKAEIEAEMLELRGPSGFNGSIHDAYIEFRNLRKQLSIEAERDRDAAETDLRNILRKEMLNLASESTMILSFQNIPQSFCSLSLYQAFARFKAAESSVKDFLTQTETAQTKHNKLASRLYALAQWQPGTDILIGGELFEVNNKLQCISDSLALRKAQLIGQFYQELATPVTDADKVKRCSCLQAIYNELENLP